MLSNLSMSINLRSENKPSMSGHSPDAAANSPLTIYLDWIGEGGEHPGVKPFHEKGALRVKTSLNLPTTKRQVLATLAKAKGPPPRSTFYVMGDKNAWEMLDGEDEINKGSVQVRAVGPHASEEMFVEMREMWGWLRETLLTSAMCALGYLKTITEASIVPPPPPPPTTVLLEESKNTQPSFIGLSTVTKRK